MKRFDDTEETQSEDKNQSHLANSHVCVRKSTVNCATFVAMVSAYLVLQKAQINKQTLLCRFFLPSAIDYLSCLTINVMMVINV